MTKTAVLINDTSTKPHIGCRLVVARIIQMAADVGIRVTATSSVHTDWRRHDDLLREMRNANIVIVNGEGTLHHSVAAARALAAVGPFCRDAQVPAVLVNSVYQDNDESIAESCRAFDRIYVRESRSAASARAQNLRAEVVPDLTLTSDIMKGFAALERHDTILMTDNANKQLGMRTIDHGVARPDVEFLTLNTHESHDYFLPTGSMPDRTFLENGPVQILASRRKNGSWLKALRAGISDPRHAIRRVRSHRSLGRTRSATEILQGIASCGGLVAGRFHAVCLALLSDTPFGALPSNTAKAEGLLADAGLTPRITHDPAEALRLAQVWTDAERQSASCFVLRARSDAQAMFREIASVAR